jgi:hypothetical protein
VLKARNESVGERKFCCDLLEFYYDLLATFVMMLRGRSLLDARSYQSAAKKCFCDDHVPRVSETCSLWSTISEPWRRMTDITADTMQDAYPSQSNK